ncbi:ECF transporter S component [Paenibacillus sp. TRM 82003]|uniref:ECF transporter S component n=1 Tax=Kineococcus sp. TRM81007 TaxID=2925831 RepID=UPI001F590DBA|nr:ECF transporter S component [Kineococcus sp. TRM81007]MCI2237372.1 ECF transporter S component [Kineococcus sp. TRM81007]MCI3926521.1 ECF transporter S component [Paenibacillus sp. TRM 82003]
MSTTVKTRTRRPAGRWRTVDLVTAAVLGVAFGVVFWGWHFAYSALDPLFALFPPVAGLVSGVWLLPAVVGALVVRRPGAALLAEMVAASVEALLGTRWSASVLVSGGIQGLGVEIAVALFLWRRWSLGVAVLGGVLAASLESVYEWFAYWSAWGFDWKLVYLGLFAVSGALIAGLGGWAVVRALARAGALSAFAAGHEHRARG